MKTNHNSLAYKMRAQPNKTYKDLRQKQKVKIANWMYQAVCECYREYGKMPEGEDASRMDEVMVDETFLGADGIESKLVYIEKDVDGIKQIQIFYAIPEGEGSLLMEIGTYEGVPEMIDSKIEEMLGNFKLTAE